MRVQLTENFIKDVERCGDQKLAARAFKVTQDIAGIDSPLQIPNFKKLKGTRNAFRIRIADYRIGVLLEADIVVFMRCLSRKDIYKVFP